MIDLYGSCEATNAGCRCPVEARWGAVVGRVKVGAEVFGGIGNVLELGRGWPSKGMWMVWLFR